MADWNQAIMLHMPPQVSVREMMGNMPCSLDMWNATNAGAFVALLQDQKCPSHQYSVSDCTQSLLQEPNLAAECSLSGKQFSPSDLMFIIIGKQRGILVPQSIETSTDEQPGLGSVVISADLSLIMPHMATGLLNAVARWQSLWQENLRALSGKAKNKGGYEKYSDEYACIIEKVINAVTSGEPRPPYLVGIGHDSITESHEFLVQYCQSFAR